MNNNRGRYFFYKGSTDSPPCTLNSINWYVMEYPFLIDGQALNADATVGGALPRIFEVLSRYAGNSYVSAFKTPATNTFFGNMKTATSWKLVDASSFSVKRGGCFPDYWTHDMTKNLAVWYMIPFMTIFFVITLMWEAETSFEHNC